MTTYQDLSKSIKGLTPQQEPPRGGEWTTRNSAWLILQYQEEGLIMKLEKISWWELVYYKERCRNEWYRALTSHDSDWEEQCDKWSAEERSAEEEINVRCEYNRTHDIADYTEEQKRKYYPF